MTPASQEVQTLLQLIRGKILQLPVKKALKDLFLEDLVRAVDCLAREDFTGLNTVLTLLTNQISTKVRSFESSPTNIEPLLKEIYALQQILFDIAVNSMPPSPPATVPPAHNNVLAPATNPEYGFFYNLSSNQSIPEGHSVIFNTQGPLSENVRHTPGQAEINLALSGIYQINFFLTTTEAHSIFELCLNHSPLPGSRLRQFGATPLQGHCLVAVGIPGSLTLKNAGRTTRLGTASGHQTVVDASLTLVKLADLNPGQSPE